MVQASLCSRDVVKRLSRIVGTQQKMLEETDIIDVGQLLRSLPGTIAGLHLVRRQGPIELRLHLSEGLFVRAAGGELLEVFLNLANNAADAMPEGGVLEVEAKVEGKRVIITFQDQGHGADAATLVRFFAPFFSTKGSQGKGLGL